MGIALFTLSSLFLPLQNLHSRRWNRRGTPLKESTGNLPAHTTSQDSRPQENEGVITNHTCQKDLATPRGPLRLRVRRSIETGIPAGCAGRMMISGRMADVCAELDRMVALEAGSEELCQG